MDLCLRNPSPCKSQEPAGMNPRVLKELDDVTGRPLFMFERPSRFGEVPNGLEKAKCCTCFQKEQGLPKLLQAGGFTSGKSQKQVLLEAVSGHIEEKNVTGKTQHGFTKGNHQY